MQDHYLQDPSRLNGQPKRTIGDYVESSGILVPRRFANLAQAKASGLDIIARSEHEQEYAGASGLCRSLKNKDLVGLSSEEGLARLGLKPKPVQRRVNDYCRLKGISREEFEGELSYSFWEQLGGFNRTVVADSSIPDRFHVMTYFWEDPVFVANYVVVEKGNIILSGGTPLPSELVQGLPQLIETYQKVRHLPNFDPNHCPIMELQTLGGDNYFLQSHRCRDFEPVDFLLEREPTGEEIEIDFVRGATPPEGMTIETAMYEDPKGSPDLMSAPTPGFFTHPWDVLFAELVTRQRDLVINVGDLKFGLQKVVQAHYSRSSMFKPRVSFLHPGEEKLVRGSSELYDPFAETRETQIVMMHILADGRRALARRLD